MVGVIQLHQEDVPEIGCPEGSDLFQLFWCPTTDHDSFRPKSVVMWSSAARCGMEDNPDLWSGAEGDYVPSWCDVHPEKVIELPNENIDLRRPRSQRSSTGRWSVVRLGRTPGVDQW
jgi:hypothetical protein